MQPEEILENENLDNIREAFRLLGFSPQQINHHLISLGQLIAAQSLVDLASQLNVGEKLSSDKLIKIIQKKYSETELIDFLRERSILILRNYFNNLLKDSDFSLRERCHELLPFLK